jgi:hypothetical protein
MDVTLAYRLPISSRWGNRILLVMGVLIAVASLALLVYSLVTTWGYGGRLEHAIRVFLLLEMLAGVAIASGAQRNLAG